MKRKKPNGLTIKKCAISLNLFPPSCLRDLIEEICSYKYFLYLKRREFLVNVGAGVIASICFLSRAHFPHNLRGFLEPSQAYHYTYKVPEPTSRTT
jgi:hypothetical protein